MIKRQALHGWLDNAASFDALAPLFPHCAILALDQAGCAQSDFRPASSTYHLWDDVLDMVAVLDQMGWAKAHCLGHSRGAMLSVLLACTQPECIKGQILLDGFLPEPVDASSAPKQLKSFVNAFSQPTKWRYHESAEKLIQARMAAGNISLSAVKLLAELAIHHDDNGFYWRVDPRLRYPSAIKLAAEQVLAFADDVSVPTLVILANKGVGQLGKIQAVIKERPAYFSCIELDGGHHFHMEAAAEEVAQLCLIPLS